MSSLFAITFDNTENLRTGRTSAKPDYTRQCGPKPAALVRAPGAHNSTPRTDRCSGECGWCCHKPVNTPPRPSDSCTTGRSPTDFAPNWNDEASSSVYSLSNQSRQAELSYVTNPKEKLNFLIKDKLLKIPYFN